MPLRSEEPQCAFGDASEEENEKKGFATGGTVEKNRTEEMVGAPTAAKEREKKRLDGAMAAKRADRAAASLREGVGKQEKEISGT